MQSVCYYHSLSYWVLHLFFLSFKIVAIVQNIKKRFFPMNWTCANWYRHIKKMKWKLIQITWNCMSFLVKVNGRRKKYLWIQYTYTYMNDWILYIFVSPSLLFSVRCKVLLVLFERVYWSQITRKSLWKC